MTDISRQQAEDSSSSGSFGSLYDAYRKPEAELSAAEAASTFYRFFRSGHVRDLRLIVQTTVFLFLLLVAIMAAIALLGVLSSDLGTQTLDASAAKLPNPNAGMAKPTRIDSVVHFAQLLVTYLGSAVGATGLILAWAYRSASARLGVIDLFACEISTLCRVGTIMDVSTRYIDQYASPPAMSAVVDKPQSGNSGGFTSQEDYFPILQTNAPSLQLLEALVVKDITQFYTYMKAARDCLRKLSQIQPTYSGTLEKAASGSDLWHASVVDVVYMLFLAYESGRKAIENLIEFQPTRAEARIVILLTELKCYSFLLERYHPSDLHHDRLEQRRTDYFKIIEELRNEVEDSSKKDKNTWAPAAAAIRQLMTEYNAIQPQQHRSMAA